MFLQACLNGDRETGVPRSPDELAAAAKACVVAGAISLHVHPRDGDGLETVDAQHVGAAAQALRAAVPGVELSFSTGLWITAGDVDTRAQAVSAWTEVPDLVSLNLAEEGWQASLQVKLASLKWISDPSNIATFESSPGNHRAFCRRCGSRAPQRGRLPVWAVPAGGLDEDPGVRPQVGFYAKSAPAWCAAEVTGQDFDVLPPREFWGEFMAKVLG